MVTNTSDSSPSTDERVAGENPLLDLSGLPCFGEIRPEHSRPLSTCCSPRRKRRWIARPMQPRLPWADVVETTEAATEPLSRAWGIVGHLNAVADTPELRTAYGENLPRVTEFWSNVGQNLALFEKYKAIVASPDLRIAQRRAQEDPAKLAARFPLVRRRTARRPEAALFRTARAAGRARQGIFRSRARRDERLRLYRRRPRRNSRGSRPTWCRPRASRAEEGQRRRLEVHAALARRTCR